MKPSKFRLAAVSACLAAAAFAGHSAVQAQGGGAPAAAVAAPAPAPGAAPAAPGGRAGAAPAAAGRAGAAPGRGGAYPSVRSTDPAAVERGRALYTSTFGCADCHAADIRGVPGRGNSLLRSQVNMIDANGELLARATREVTAHAGRFNAVTDAQFADIGQFMKNFVNIGTGGVQIITPAVYQSGDAAAGRQYFTANCASCHSVTAGQASPAANLAGIGANIPASGVEARGLQQRWLSPTTTKPVMAVVTLANGQRLEGRATRIDEFSFSMVLADGTVQTFGRNGDNPKIEMTYPLAAHAALLRTITDKNIHDVTGYLVTLK